MEVGFHFQDDSYTGPQIGAATFLDVGGWGSAQHARQRMCRPYFTGRPDPVWMAQKANEWAARDCPVVLGNEPNISAEGFGGGPAEYAAWFLDAANVAWVGTRLYYAGMSPSGDWRSWYTHPLARSAIARAAGLCIHAYGELEQMEEIVGWIHEQYPTTPLWLSEFNWGAGRRVADPDAWVRATVPPFLDWLARIPQVEAACWFSWKWDQSPTLPSSVDGAGTGVERVLREWTPPKEAPVADIVLTVPNKAAHAVAGNYEVGPRPRTIGVVLHTTRGGGKPASEYPSTVNWFQNPDAGVSAHLVIGLPPFDEVARCVHDTEIAYHARECNQTHLSIELCQPNATDPLTAFQYRAAAEACRLWAAVYKFPLKRAMSETVPGLIGHEDTEAGKRDGKTDPGPAFDWPRFLALTGGTPVPDTTDQLRDQTFALASQLQALDPKWRAAGWPSMAAGVGSNAEAIKSLVRASKGEK